MASIQKIINDAAQVLRFRFDKKRTAAYGVHRSYSMLIYQEQSSGQPYICISLCAGCGGEPVNAGYLRSIRLPERVRCTADGFRINVQFSSTGKSDQDVSKIVDIVNTLTDFLSEGDYMNCDERGILGSSSAYFLKGKLALLGDETAEILHASVSKNAQAEHEKREHYAAGALGALLGAAAGALLILLIARLKLVSSLASIAMGFAVVFGYKKLGKKFSKVSVIICGLISIAVVYLTFRLDAAIDLHSAVRDAKLDLSFGFCFSHTKELFEAADAGSTYFHNFILMVGMGIVGTIAAVYLEYSEQKSQFEMYKLGK